jgi:hypothetical protein
MYAIPARHRTEENSGKEQSPFIMMHKYSVLGVL